MKYRNSYNNYLYTHTRGKRRALRALRGEPATEFQGQEMEKNIRALMILMIPKRFFSSLHSHTQTHDDSFESRENCFWLERPFFNDDGSETKRKKKEKWKKFFRIYRHNWMPPEKEREREKSSLQSGLSKRASFHFLMCFDSILSPRRGWNWVNKKNRLRAAQSVSCAPSSRLFVPSCFDFFFDRSLSFASFSSFSSCVLLCLPENRKIFFISRFSLL